MANLYTPLKIFHYTEKVDSLPLENPVILPPLHIRIKPTNICNHNCSYCAYRAENLQLGQDMSRLNSQGEDARDYGRYNKYGGKGGHRVLLEKELKN